MTSNYFCPTAIPTSGAELNAILEKAQAEVETTEARVAEAKEKVDAAHLAIRWLYTSLYAYIKTQIVILSFIHQFFMTQIFTL